VENVLAAAAVWWGRLCRYWAQDRPSREEGKQWRLQNSHSRSYATSVQVLLWWRVHIRQSADAEGTWPGTSLWQGSLLCDTDLI